MTLRDSIATHIHDANWDEPVFELGFGDEEYVTGLYEHADAIIALFRTAMLSPEAVTVLTEMFTPDDLVNMSPNDRKDWEYLGARGITAALDTLTGDSDEHAR